jgi:hypothetical protein
VSDAHDLRTQAGLYFALSRQMSRHGDAEYFRARAEQHLAKAVEAEGKSATSSSSPAASSSAQTRTPTMPRYFFPVEYDGFRYEDDRGEVFSTAEEAEHYAKRVSAELSRNNSKSITVFVIAEDRLCVLHSLECGNPYSARPGASLGYDEGLREQTRLSGVIARMKNSGR